MNKVVFEGTHYNIGYRWGKMLKNNNISLLNNMPFALTEEHIKFAEKCTPFYEEAFAEIIEEIKGIADGQECCVQDIKALLFGMYCIMPSTNCSCFAAKTKEGKIILARNSDFLTKIEKLYMNTLYKLLDSYSFRANTTAFVEMEDGMNEHGLVIGLTSVAPQKINPGINAGMLLRLFLEKCKTVQDVIDLIKTITLSSSQTFVLADSLGNAALLECCPEKIEIKKIDSKTNFLCSTNMFNLKTMKPYNNLPKDNWFAEERYAVLERFLSSHKYIDIEMTKSLLSGEQGFMCQYDRTTGKDTVWPVIFDMADASIHFAKGNPARNPYSIEENIFNR